MSDKAPIHIVRNAQGWWEVRRPSGEIVARYRSELQARDAGRLAAQSNESDLVIHQLEGRPRYEAYDPQTRQLKPAVDADGAANVPVPDERRRLILLVEDQVEARELYADYLAYAGFSVVTAINGHEAIRLARLLRPDLILMDIRLPGMDGLEATADIKADPDLAHIPIVAITGDTSTDIGARARRAGCTTVITKPVMPDEIARKITLLLATLQPQRSNT